MARAGELFWGIGMKVVTGSRYLGSFIGNRESETTWLDEKVKGGTELVRLLLWVPRKHPKSAYAGMQKSLQHEWALVKWATPDIGDAFGPV